MVQTRLSPQRGRGLSVEGGQAARLGLDLTLTPVPIPSLYEAGPFSWTKEVSISEPLSAIASRFPEVQNMWGRKETLRFSQIHVQREMIGISW
jgi:hypothetical protein